MNQKFLQALRGENKGSPPIWLMRQAGRYMPAYRAIREKHSFLEMCKQPELAAKITRQPIDAFGMDAAIFFSDILVVPDALGLGLRFEDSVGPVFERPLHSESEADALPSISIAEELSYVRRGIQAAREGLKVPLIGFCGAPFTVASYMIEGRSSRSLKKTKQWMLRSPASFHRLLSRLCKLSIDYLRMQIDAGAQAIQIFDSWANFLGHAHFREFSLAYLGKMVAALKETKIPLILFCRGSSVFASQLAEISPTAISLDWNIDMAQARANLPSSLALQGNLDPDILCAPVDVVQRQTRSLLQSMQGDSRYIFNLGHGVLPDTPCETVKILVETVRDFAHA